MRALTAAHEQSYGRPVDEQRQHRGRGQQQRESTRVRQYLLFGDRLVYDPFLASGGAIGRGRGAIGRGGRASGVPRGGRAINTCGRAIDTRGPARGLAVIYLRQAKEDLVLGYVADLIGDLGDRILDLFLADVVLIGDLLDRISRARRQFLLLITTTSGTAGRATRRGGRGSATRRGGRGSATCCGGRGTSGSRSTRGACGRTSSRTSGSSRGGTSGSAIGTSSGPRGGGIVPIVVVLVVEVLVDEDDLYLAAVVGLDVQVPRAPTILGVSRVTKGINQEHEPYRHQGCKNENLTSDRQNRVVRPVPHCPTSQGKKYTNNILHLPVRTPQG